MKSGPAVPSGVLITIALLWAVGPISAWSQSPLLPPGAAKPPSGGAAPGEEAAQPVDERPECPECEGSGKEECPQCKGRKEIQVRCPDRRCRDGKKKCRNQDCVGGWTTCRRCRGRGKVAGALNECGLCYGTGRQECNNFRCRRGLEKCRECAGDGQVPEPCRGCEARGSVQCTECRGEGRLPALPPPVPGRELRRKFRSLAQIAEAMLQAMREFAKREQEFEAVRARVAVARDAVRDMLGRPEWPAVKTSRSRVRDSWERCEAKAERVGREYAEMVSLRAAADEQLERLEAMAAELEQPDAHAPAPRSSELKEARRVADELRVRVRWFSKHLLALSKRIETTSAAIDSFRKRRGEEAQRHEKERKRQQAIDRKFNEFLDQLPRLAAETGLPELEGELKSVSAGGELHMGISYLDPDTEPADDPAEIQPTESYLEKIPYLVDKAFAAIDDMEKLSVEVFAEGITPYGGIEPVRIQSFIGIRRSSLEKLKEGMYWPKKPNGDYREVLKRFGKTWPAYPRPRPDPLGDAWTVTLLIVVFGLAIAVILLARLHLR